MSEPLFRIMADVTLPVPVLLDTEPDGTLRQADGVHYFTAEQAAEKTGGDAGELRELWASCIRETECASGPPIHKVAGETLTIPMLDDCEHQPTSAITANSDLNALFARTVQFRVAAHHLHELASDAGLAWADTVGRREVIATLAAACRRADAFLCDAIAEAALSIARAEERLFDNRLAYEPEKGAATSRQVDG